MGPRWRLFQSERRHHELRNYKKEITVSILIVHTILGHSCRFFLLMEYVGLEILNKEACIWTSMDSFSQIQAKSTSHMATENSPPNSDHFTEKWLLYFYHIPCFQMWFQPWSPFLYASPWQSHGVPASIISSVGMTPVDSQSFVLCVYLKSQVSLKIPPSLQACHFLHPFLLVIYRPSGSPWGHY